MRPLDVRHTSYYKTDWLKMIVVSIGDDAYKRIDDYAKNGTEIYITIKKAEISASKCHNSIGKIAYFIVKRASRFTLSYLCRKFSCFQFYHFYIEFLLLLKPSDCPIMIVVP